MPVVDIHTKLPPLLKRRNVLQLLTITLLAEIGYGVLNLYTMPLYLREDRALGTVVSGLVVTAFLLSEAVFKSTMGHLADVYGRRRLMVLGPALTAITPILTIAVPNTWGHGTTLALCLLRVIDGLAAAMLWPAAYALMGDICEEEHKQEGLSMLNTCFMLGIALAFPIGGFINDTIGPSFHHAGGVHTPSLYMATIVFICAAACSFFFVPSGKLHRIATKSEDETEGTDLHTFFSSIRRIPQYMVLGFVTFMGVGFPMVTILWFAKDQFGVKEGNFGLLALPAALAMAAGSIPLGKLGVRIGRVKAIHLGMFLCVVGLGVLSSGAILPFMRSVWVVAVGAIPVGIGFLMTIPAWYASVSDVDPSRKAANIGAVMTAQGIGAIIGTPLGTFAYGKLYKIGMDLGQHSRIFGPELGYYSPFVGSFFCVGIGLILGLKILNDRPSAS